MFKTNPVRITDFVIFMLSNNIFILMTYCSAMFVTFWG
jgi:hypothetical protein